MPSPSFEEGQAAAPVHNGTPRAHKRIRSTGPRLTHYWSPHSRCHTRATRRAALRSRATVRRPASRAARTSSSTTWPALIASSRRARVRHQRREATSRASRCGRHTTARRATPHAVAAPIRNEPPTHERRTLTPRPTNHRRRLRALLLRLAQVHRQVRDAAHHAEAQVEFFKYY